MKERERERKREREREREREQTTRKHTLRGTLTRFVAPQRAPPKPHRGHRIWRPLGSGRHVSCYLQLRRLGPPPFREVWAADLLHIPDMIRRHGCLLTCFAPERRHRFAKSAAVLAFQSRYLGRFVIQRLTAHYLENLPGAQFELHTIQGVMEMDPERAP